MFGLNVRFTLLLALAGLLSAPLQANLNPESGAFLFQTYAPKDYGANQQNWAIVQDARGVMYFANTDGVLEFDGVTWRLIHLTVHSGVRSLAIDSRGTVFVGARGIFGYLASGSDGAPKFVSLLDKVPKTDRSFNDISNVLPTAEGVYFASHRRLFLYTSAGSLKVFRPTRDFGRAFTYHDELFITSSDQGLLTIKGQDLVRSKVRGDQKVLSESPIYSDGAVPFFSANRKLYRFSLGSIEPFTTLADKYFQEHVISSLRHLPGGDLAVGTENGGLVLLNPQGEVERIVRKTNGLPSDYISAVYPDHQGAVWIATDSGLARFPLLLTRFGEQQGIHGNVWAVARLGSTIYAGTSLGLFRMHNVPGAEPLFTPVPEIQEEIFAIVQHDGIFFVGAQHGLYQISGSSVRRLSNAVVYDISFSQRNRDLMYTAGGNGIEAFRRNGSQWTVVNKERGTGQDFRTVIEAPDGRIWGTTEYSIWRVDFASTPPETEQFTAADGVPGGGWLNVFLFRNHPIFASESGLLQFSESAKHFVADSELGAQFSDSKIGVEIVKEDPLSNVWITGKGYHGVLRGTEWLAAPLLESGIAEIYAMYHDPDGTCWASGSSGTLFRYQRPPPANNSFGVLIRGAILTNENIPIYRGEGARPQFRLPYKDNALRFEYAAPFFEDQSAVQYQFRLEGSEKNWSPWTAETRKDYTNLPEGSYTFRVRARNPHGVLSSEAQFRFSLLAPWYRTWWAYAIYVAAFLLAGWLILRWRLAALEAKNKWLENVVAERTAEVRTERDQNEALLLNILPRPVASELRSTGSVKPTSFEDVTVCFSDFVGFTLSSEKLPPQELITSLNEYFTAFDEIIGRYGLEKLKTIGDAYMFAGGLPNASPSHAVDAVMAALEMVQVVRKLARPEKGVNWSIRLGLYSGPVVAGVVGVRKFAFDIWGNTVNFASRMESAGSANRVNLSETTGRRVLDFIECEPRGAVRIKEGREMDMYFAVRLKPELLLGPIINGIPEAFRQKYEQVFSTTPRSFPNLNGNYDS